MMSATESTSASCARRTTVTLKLTAYATTLAVKLRAVAPYALIELVLPGGSVMALLLWLYRRQKKIAFSRPTRFSP